MDYFSVAAGEALRSARKNRGFTLRDVEALSEGGFKASALAGYERAERTISLDRFCRLSRLYGIPPDRFLAHVLRGFDPSGRQEVVIDLNRLSQLDIDEATQLVLEFIHQMKVQRGDYLAGVITLRAGDVEALSLDAGLSPQKLLDRIDVAIVS